MNKNQQLLMLVKSVKSMKLHQIVQGKAGDFSSHQSLFHLVFKERNFHELFEILTM